MYNYITLYIHAIYIYTALNVTVRPGQYPYTQHNLSAPLALSVLSQRNNPLTPAIRLIIWHLKCPRLGAPQHHMLTRH